MQKFEKANFNVAEYDESDFYGKFVIEPLERGFWDNFRKLFT